MKVDEQEILKRCTTALLALRRKHGPLVGREPEMLSDAFMEGVKQGMLMANDVDELVK